MANAGIRPAVGACPFFRLGGLQHGLLTAYANGRAGKMVEPRGVEPLSSATRMLRSPNRATAPWGCLGGRCTQFAMPAPHKPLFDIPAGRRDGYTFRQTRVRRRS